MHTTRKIEAKVMNHQIFFSRQHLLITWSLYQHYTYILRWKFQLNLVVLVKWSQNILVHSYNVEKWKHKPLVTVWKRHQELQLRNFYLTLKFLWWRKKTCTRINNVLRWDLKLRKRNIIHLKNVKTAVRRAQSQCKLRLGLLCYYWQRLRDDLNVY